MAGMDQMQMLMDQLIKANPALAANPQMAQHLIQSMLNQGQTGQPPPQQQQQFPPESMPLSRPPFAVRPPGGVTPLMSATRPLGLLGAPGRLGGGGGGLMAKVQGAPPMDSMSMQPSFPPRPAFPPANPQIGFQTGPQSDFRSSFQAGHQFGMQTGPGQQFGMQTGQGQQFGMQTGPGQQFGMQTGPQPDFEPPQSDFPPSFQLSLQQDTQPSFPPMPQTTPQLGLQNIPPANGFVGQPPFPAIGDAEPASRIDKGEEVKITDPQGNPAVVKPLESFSECPWPATLQQEIIQGGFTKPSQIQAYAWPIALQGFDVVGVAATGSGKTIAFLFPAFMHILNNRLSGRDPTLLVLAPTRELACQIEKEAHKFGRTSNISTVCAYGGAPKGDQLRAMRNGCHCLIATPGRLNDFLESNAVNLGGICKLVLDEADRMLDMGFEPQIRKILKAVPSRQRHTLLFSATWPKEVRKLAEEFLNGHYMVEIGNRNELKANEDITQIVKIMSGYDKDGAIMQTLQEHKIGQDPNGRALIFCATKKGCDQIERQLSRQGQRIVAIHGDKDQRQRDEALESFKSGRVSLLVATDVAARGLDIKGIVLVINYDPANNTEDYVHRVGRTGRGGNKGTAVTFLTSEQGFKAKGIMEVMEKTQQLISEDLRRLAASAPEGKGKGKSRFREGGKGKSRSRSRGGDRGGGGDRGDFGGGGGKGMPTPNPVASEENKRSESPPRRQQKKSESPPRKQRERSRSRRSRRRDRSRSRRRDRSRSRRRRDIKSRSRS